LPTLAEAIEVVRLSADLSVGWKELYELGKKYAYLRRRLYGVQVNERLMREVVLGLWPQSSVNKRHVSSEQPSQSPLSFV